MASPLLIYTANADPPPSPNHSPSVSVVVFIFVCCYRRLPHPSPMLCLIVVFIIVVDRRPSSIFHHISSFVILPLLVISIHRPSSAVMSPPFLPPFLLNIITITGLKGSLLCISVDGGGAHRPPCLRQWQCRHLHHIIVVSVVIVVIIVAAHPCRLLLLRHCHHYST